LQCVAVCCSVLRCLAMCCRVSQFVAVSDISFVKELFVDRVPLHRSLGLLCKTEWFFCFFLKEPPGFCLLVKKRFFLRFKKRPWWVLFGGKPNKTRLLCCSVAQCIDVVAPQKKGSFGP